ncbi:hypothetical protein TrLO_g2064 [Triparma laevis f. longispina]|uniref:Uncharacterized protein n=1 Tax=Triparma laevis f. longispina TaxID=1714387 RepID=A0A9W7FQ16_9STRA|nr:hypothetical protein TrLO_g2064 [Triparma laevis f. longispina]
MSSNAAPVNPARPLHSTYLSQSTSTAALVRKNATLDKPIRFDGRSQAGWSAASTSASPMKRHRHSAGTELSLRRIPRSSCCCCFTRRLERAPSLRLAEWGPSPLGRIIDASLAEGALPRLLDSRRFAAFRAHERNHALSAWKPCLDVLPAAYYLGRDLRTLKIFHH